MVLTITDLHTEISTAAGTVQAVGGVSLSVAAGQTLGLVGESGCGKTMTAMSISGLLPPGGRVVSGGIELNGHDLLDLPPAELRRFRSEQIGVVFQNPLTALNPRLSVGAQVREALPASYRRGRRIANDRVVELLSLAGVPRPAERLLDYPHELSGGLAQRVVIAMALAREPKLLIADEPTTALDVSIQAQILDRLDEMRTTLGVAVLLVTHDIGVVIERAQHVAVMYAGQIVEQGPTESVIGAPVHPYTRGLLNAIPRTSGGVRLEPIEGGPPELIDPPAGCRFAPRCAFATGECVDERPPVTTRGSREFVCWHPLGIGLQGRIDVTDQQLDIAAPAAERAGRPPLIEISDVSRDFPIHVGLPGVGRTVARSALADVTLEVFEGDSIGIVGESGCGKSTLARLVAGLDRPTRGRILYRGEDITALAKQERLQWRRDVQMIFQDPYSSLDPRMTVAAIVREPLVAQHGRRAATDDRIDSLLDEVGLREDVRDRRPAQLSGGQRQRVGIARALALDPRLIIADEAVSALDVSVQATILNLLRKLQRERELTYLFISHDLDVIRYLCHRVAVMYLGRLVEVGDTEQVYSQPAHPYTAALLSSVPGSATGRAQRLRGEVPSADQVPTGCRFHTRCPLAGDVCREATPLLAGDPGQLVACHFPLVDRDPELVR